MLWLAVSGYICFDNILQDDLIIETDSTFELYLLNYVSLENFMMLRYKCAVRMKYVDIMTGLSFNIILLFKIYIILEEVHK